MKFIYYFLVATFISFSASALNLPPDKFVLAPGVNDYYATQSALTIGHLQPSGGLFFIYTDTPSQIIDKRTGKQVTPVVRNNATLELVSSFGLFNVVELGLGVPIILFQNVDGLTSLGQQDDDMRMDGWGDVSLFAKGKLFSYKTKKNVTFATALSLSSTLPTGTMVGNTGSTFMPALLLEMKTKRVDVGLNAGFRFMKDQGFEFQNQNVAVDGEFVGSVGARVKVIPELNFAGDLLLSTPDGKQIPMELFVGPEGNLPLGFKLKAGMGIGLTQEVGAPMMRAIAGLSWTPDFRRKPCEINITIQDCSNCPKCEKCEPKVIKEVVEVVREEIYLPPVYFATDKEYVMPQSIPILNRTIRVMKDNPDIGVVVIWAHADSRGSKKHNVKLTERRAKFVYDYLIKGGIDPNRVYKVAFGETTPTDTNDTKDGRSRNRRAEFTFGKEDKGE